LSLATGAEEDYKSCWIARELAAFANATKGAGNDRGYDMELFALLGKIM
jgi:hypothetical protein